NNHLYWAGVEVSAAGIAANDRELFDWGMNTYHVGVAQIQPDGTLPLEIRRGQRAAPVRGARLRDQETGKAFHRWAGGQQLLHESRRDCAGPAGRTSRGGTDQLGEDLR